MMSITSFQNIRLATDNGDEEAVLVLRDGRLSAVLCRLGDMHGAVAGEWFVEATFGVSIFAIQQTFSTPAAFSQWLDDRIGRQ